MSETAPQTQTETQTTEQKQDLLSQMVEGTRPIDEAASNRIQGYFEEFLRQVVAPGQVISKKVTESINHWITQIDQKLSQQLDEILHDSEFQKLESTWRGIHYLVDKTETSKTMKLRVLNATKDVLREDLNEAVEFDQSALFKKIYEENFGTYGGEPFGLLVGDYEFDHTPVDVGTLEKLSGVAAAAHAPFVSGTAPRMLGMQTWTELPGPRDLEKIFESVDYAVWRSFRESEDSRYVALTLPRVLARYPYGPDTNPVKEFNYEEGVDGTVHDKYLWMNASWAYAVRITEAFVIDGWFHRIRGPEGGGKVQGLPVHTFPSPGGGVAMKCPTETLITDRREAELSKLGFLGLLHCMNTDFAAFFGAQSVQKPQKFQGNPDADTNAELSAKFNYILSTSRFAHYLKVMCRNWIGSIMEVEDCQRKLNAWILNYVHPRPQDASEADRAKKPLREAKIEVTEVEGRPGWYEAKAWIRPHFQLEGLNVALSLVGKIPGT
ncbi:MAG: type VI secretion system contractile sheath large subunit [Gemmataceae bacterium]